MPVVVEVVVVVWASWLLKGGERRSLCVWRERNRQLSPLSASVVAVEETVLIFCLGERRSGKLLAVFASPLGLILGIFARFFLFSCLWSVSFKFHARYHSTSIANSCQHESEIYIDTLPISFDEWS